MFVNELFEANQMQVKVIYPGRFQPAHKGHKAVYDHLCKQYGADNVYIVTSDKVDPPKSPFNFAEKHQMWSLMGVPADKVVQSSQPYQAKELVANFDAANTVLIFAISEKDMAEDPRFSFKPKKDGSPSYFQPFTSIDQCAPLAQHGYMATVPTFDFKVLGQPANSATQIRAQFASADEATQKKIVQDLFGKFDPKVFAIMQNKLATVNAEVEEGAPSTELQDLMRSTPKGKGITKTEFQNLKARKPKQERHCPECGLFDPHWETADGHGKYCSLHKKKTAESVEEGWKSNLAGAALAGSMALGGGAAQASQAPTSSQASQPTTNTISSNVQLPANYLQSPMYKQILAKQSQGAGQGFAKQMARSSYMTWLARNNGVDTSMQSESIEESAEDDARLKRALAQMGKPDTRTGMEKLVGKLKADDADKAARTKHSIDVTGTAKPDSTYDPYSPTPRVNTTETVEQSDLTSPDPKIRALANAVVKMKQELHSITGEQVEESADDYVPPLRYVNGKEVDQKDTSIKPTSLKARHAELAKADPKKARELGLLLVKESNSFFKKDITNKFDLIEHARQLTKWMRFEGIDIVLDKNDYRKIASRIISPKIYVNESKDLQSARKTFISKLDSLDQLSKLNIKEGNNLSVIDAQIIGNYIELWGFLTPKVISKITRNGSGSIKQIEFNNDPEDIYPRAELSTYNGEEIHHSAFFDNKTDAEHALSMLLLGKPNDLEISNNITESVESITKTMHENARQGNAPVVMECIKKLMPIVESAPKILAESIAKEVTQAVKVADRNRDDIFEIGDEE